MHLKHVLPAYSYNYWLRESGCPKAAILLLFHLDPCFVACYFGFPFQFTNHLAEEEKAGCFTLNMIIYSVAS